MFRQINVSKGKSIMKKNTSHTIRKSGDLQLIEGLSKHLEKSWAPVLAGKKYTRTQLVALLQRRVDAVNAVTTAKANWHVAQEHDAEVNAETIEIVDALKQTLLAMFGKSPDVLAALGLAPRKAPRALTAEELVLKAERARATRQARHTMGTRQKRAIQGGFTEAPPVIASPTAPSPAEKVASPTMVTVGYGAGSTSNGAMAPPTGGS
jgi:hypothetical protein